MSSTAEDVGTSPQTCCATCRTVFEVSAELLDSSDTRVRCGECYRIFDALDNLVRADGRAGAPGSTDGAGGRGDGPGGGRGDGPPSSTAAPARAGGGGEVTVFPGRGEAANGSTGTRGEALDVTYSDFDLFSEDADLPDVAYFDRTSETPEFDFDSVELDDDETFNDTLFAHDITIDAAAVGAPPATDRFALPPMAIELEVIEPSAPRAPLTFVYRDADNPAPDEAKEADRTLVPPRPATRAPEAGAAPDSRSPGEPPPPAAGRPAPAIDAGPRPASPPADVPGTGGVVASVPFEFGAPAPRRRAWPVAAMGLALAALLAGLHLWNVRDAPGDDPLVRPAYELACRIAGCEVPARVALDRLTLLRREMYEHADIDDALVIDVAFRNDAPFAQRHPVLVVRLSTPSGRLVARRAFAPQDYLPADAAADAASSLAAGARLDIRLEVGDPGEYASSFEIDFREP